MAKKSGEKTIRGRRFTVGQLPATQSLLLGHRIVAVLSPLLGGGVDAGMATAMGGDGLGGAALGALATTDLGKVVPLLFDRLTGRELDGILKELLSTVVCQRSGSGGGTELVEVVPVFDEFFQGELALLFEVAAYALEVNYKDFWDALVEKFKSWAAKAEARAEEKKKKKSAKSATSPGQSGAA